MLITDFIILPLYGKNRKIPEKSGLNHWNSLSVKDKNSVYIPIPVDIHKYKPQFFPSCHEEFSLTLTDKTVLTCKLQKNLKAFMSVPNKQLGEWLRHVFALQESEIFTIQMLDNFGIDSILIDKFDNKNYSLSFKKTNSYEDFIMDFK